MSSLQRVLVASDLSANSDIAVARAASLVAAPGTVVVLHAHSGANQRLALERELRNRVTRLAGTERVDIRLRIGVPFVEIIRVAREVDADLVVVGAHGPHWNPSAITGSTAERVVRKGDRPVLVVRQRGVSPYRRVLTAVDGSEHAATALRFALATFPEAEHRVVNGVIVPGLSMLHGADPEDLDQLRASSLAAARSEIATSLAGIWSGEPAVVREGRAADVISDVAVEWNADVVVVGTHGADALRHVLLGSTAQRVLRETPTDILLVRPTGFTFELP